MQFIDTVTALTISVIVTILVLYVVVVYKKGWLKRDLKASESYFLCPNSKCRRVFKDPIWLTDLSQTPPESYQACPHCSTSLQLSPSFIGIEQSLELESKPKASPIIKDLKSSERALPIQKDNLHEKKGITRGILKRAPHANIPKSPEKSTAPQQPKASAPTVEILKETVPSKPVETPKKLDEKNVSERPRACSHYFGYVKTLPKNTSIPDECLWCPWIVKCLTGTETIEA